MLTILGFTKEPTPVTLASPISTSEFDLLELLPSCVTLPIIAKPSMDAEPLDTLRSASAKPNDEEDDGVLEMMCSL